MNNSEQNTLAYQFATDLIESGATEQEASNILADALSDFQSLSEPEPLDAETVAQRETSYAETLVAAGRGHLVK